MKDVKICSGDPSAAPVEIVVRDMQDISLGPDDILILRSERPLSVEAFERIKRQWTEAVNQKAGSPHPLMMDGLQLIVLRNARGSASAGREPAVKSEPTNIQ